MTIVAGFKFNGGVLICADTKNAGGPTTIYQTKLHNKEYRSTAKSVFGIAGRTKFARMAIGECEKALGRIDNPTLEEMESAIQDELIAFHKKHIFEHPDRQLEAGGPHFYLLVALWSPVDGVELYSTEETAFDKVDSYECLGAGEYLGRYIIDSRFQSANMSLERVILVATTAMMRIKAFDPNCGGSSDFSVIWKTGELQSLEGFDIEQAEKFSKNFHRVANSIYEKMATSPEVNTEDVDEYTRMFVEVMVSQRQSQLREKARRDALFGALSGVEKGKP